MYCYLHIPFCETKCKYCRFASFSDFSPLKIQLYVDYLCQQIKQYNGKKEEKLDSIYFGGGTPSTLSHLQLEQIFSELKAQFPFGKHIECSFETTPQNITSTNIQKWQKIGINRISLGVQSLNNQTLTEIGRYQRKQVFAGFLALDKAKFQNISIDFIIGLPYTKQGDVKRDIELLLKKYPSIKHISVYMLEEYYYPENWKGVSFSDENYIDEYKQVKSFLEQQGFLRYELSNFAKKGYSCKHNQAYWDHSEVIAFGLDAHGYSEGKRYAYPNTFKKYYTGEMAYTDELSHGDIILEKIMFGLRTRGVSRKYESHIDMKKVAEFEKLGLLKVTKSYILLQDTGVPVLDYILKHICK